MKHENLEAELFRQQNLYIRQLEEQLYVYMEKEKAKELLIEKLNRTLDLLAEELARVKAEKEEKFKGNTRYVPTGKVISRQAVGIAIVPVVTKYHTAEFYDKKKGRKAHSAFPAGVSDDVNYDESMKAILFLLNSRCNVSLEKTAQFIENVMFKALLDAPVMHVDGTSARVNGSSHNVVVCSNGAATMYFAREHKGHAGISEIPVEIFGGILIHDHEACFYSYGTDHQECMVHIERYLKDSIENEKNLTWNKQILELIKYFVERRAAGKKT